MWLFTRVVRPCIVVLEMSGPFFLHEMIKDVLCMNPVNAEQKWLLIKTTMRDS